jgi:hypothetical protein
MGVSAVTVSVLHRRRAERFAEQLDQATGRGPRHRLRSRSDADLAGLVALSQRTATVQFKPDLAPDPEFRADLRAMLVATVEREGVVTAVVAPAKGTRRRLLAGAGSRARGAIIAGVLAGALVLSGIAAASGDAMPGDALYGVKRSTERAELAFAGSDVGRGQLYLEFARTRLAEARSVSGSATNFERALDDMDSDSRQGVKLLTTAAVERKDPAALDAVDTFVRAQQSDVGDVLDKVGGGSRTRLLSSLDLLEKVATRAQKLRATLTCGVTASNGGDVLGPRPGTCSPATNPTPTAPSGPGAGGPTPSRSSRGGTTDPTGGPGSPRPTAATPSQPAGAGGTGQSTPTPTATPGDGGLLGGVRRILGDLLGG